MWMVYGMGFPTLDVYLHGTAIRHSPSRGQSQDASQGWMVSSFSALAEYPDRVRALFKQKELSVDGRNLDEPNRNHPQNHLSFMGWDSNHPKMVGLWIIGFTRLEIVWAIYYTIRYNSIVGP